MLAEKAEPGPMDDLIGHSITYRIALGPLVTVAPTRQGLKGDPIAAARAGGFSLHADVDIATQQTSSWSELGLPAGQGLQLAGLARGLKIPVRRIDRFFGVTD